MTRGRVLHHNADLDWIPLSTGISFKPIVFFPGDTGYQLLLKVEPGAVVPRHHHTGEVHAFVLSGQRRIAGCPEVIGAGSYVYEPVDNIDTSEAIGDEPCVIHIEANGRVEYLDDDGNVVRHTDASTAIGVHVTHSTLALTRHVCATCGTQYADATGPPDSCRVCTDDRQHVGADGQQWTTHDQLAATLHNRIELDGDLMGVGIFEPFAIPQRALLLPTDAGNILWDCVSVITPTAIDEIERLGGIDLIAISHPHFYSAMVEWSDAFGGVPILVHDADRDWIPRPSPHITTWTGDRHQLSPTVALIHCPGHFPGSAVLHWTAAPHGKGVLLTGDSLHVAADRRHVSVMHSVPNYIPVAAPVIYDIRRRLADVAFDDLYGFTWGLNIIGNARQAVDESLDRYLTAIGATT